MLELEKVGGKKRKKKKNFGGQKRTFVKNPKLRWGVRAGFQKGVRHSCLKRRTGNETMTGFGSDKKNMARSGEEGGRSIH